MGMRKKEEREEKEMENEKTTMLVGITRGISKKGMPYAVLQLTKPYNSRQLNDGSVGAQVFEEFVMDESLLPALERLKTGSPISLDYEVSRGRAYLSGFSQDSK